MAPALFDHIATKKRNSDSRNKFLGGLGCISEIDLLLKRNFQLVTLSTFDNKLFKPKLISLDLNATTRFNEMSINHTLSIPDDFASNSRIDNILTTPSSQFNLHKPDVETVEERLPHPVAKLETETILTNIRQKNKDVHLKFVELNFDINSLYTRLRKFQQHNIKSHVACEAKKVNLSRKPENSNEDIIDVTNSIITNKQTSTEKFERIFDLACYLGDITDEETNLEPVAKVVDKRGKRKSEKPAPNPLALYTWKKKRVNFGSHCSWIKLKVPILDKKIADLTKLYNSLKQERLVSRASQNPEKLSTKRNGMVVDAPHKIHDDNTGCSRTTSLQTPYRHKFVKTPVNTKKTSQIDCQSLTGIGPCRLCAVQTLRDSTEVNMLAKRLDHSYHTTLSFDNDVCLSFKLENMLRTKQLNTGVNMSQSNKKKRKVKSRASSPSNSTAISGKESRSKKVSGRLKTPKLKNEPTSSNEFSSMGRLRKVRKFSDSYNYDSSKPTTPNNELCSPQPSSTHSDKLKKKHIDYDIDNIVIPYSMAATTRLERLQYKEIPTPGWRSVDDSHLPGANLTETELTDDETLKERHACCELQERKRFSTFIPASRRSNRVSRASEGHTSEPPSPFAEDFFSRSYLNTILDSPNSGSTLSNKTMAASALTPMPDDEREPSWTSRRFPLNDSECKLLNIVSTPEPPATDTLMNNRTSFRYSGASPLDSPRSSPLSYRRSPSPFPSPKDHAQVTEKNWTVKLLPAITAETELTPAEQVRKGIVLKLAKK